MNINRRSYLYDALLFIAAAALYSPSLRYGFVGDDLIYFIGNQHIRSFDVWTILRSGAIGADYLPLRDLSLAVDYLLWGENPFGFHLTNVVLYGITVVFVKHLFVRVSARLAGKPADDVQSSAFAAALVFAIHPTHRDVVCAVNNRGALMAALFCILACIQFLRYMRGSGRTYAAYAVAFICFICALLSREYSIILPLLLVLLIFSGDRTGRSAHLLHTAPFFIAAFSLYIVYKEYAMAAGYITSSAESLLSGGVAKIAVAAKIVVFYMVRMISFFGRFSEAEGSVYTLAASGIVAGVTAAAVIARRRHPQVLFGFLFFLIGLIPVLNFFKTAPVVAARYAYLPTLGLFFALTAVPFEGKKKFLSIAAVGFTLIWSFTTAHHLEYYENNIAYWENIAPYEKTADAYTQLGYAYYAGGRYESALVALRLVQPVPWNARYHATVGNACFKLGDYACAIPALETAMTLNVTDVSVPLNLARAHLERGDRAGAGRCFDFVARNFPELKAEADTVIPQDWR